MKVVKTSRRLSSDRKIPYATTSLLHNYFLTIETIHYMKVTAKVIISYDNETDSDLVLIIKQTIKGCTDNPDFTFSKSELVNVGVDLTDFEGRLSEMPTGGNIETENKNQSRAKLLLSFHTLCTSINAQKGGNLAALEGSGAPIIGSALSKGSGVYPQPEGLKIKLISVATAVNAGVKRVKGLNDHGTMFAITPVLNAPEDINQWTMKFSPSHHLTITGLTPATKYMMAAGFQGKTGTPIVWSKAIIFGTAAA